MNSPDFWTRDVRRAMHPAAVSADANQRPALLPPAEWATALLGRVVTNAKCLAVKEYLGHIGDLSPPAAPKP